MLGRDYDGTNQRLSPRDRATHMHVLGASQKGKSRFLESLIRQDIRQGHGLCLIDPHGTLHEAISKWCAYNGIDKIRHVHLIDPNETDWVTGIDPLRCDDPRDLAQVTDSVVAAFAQVWGGEDANKTPLLKKCLRAVLYALAESGRPLSDAIQLTTASDVNGLRREMTNDIDDEVFQFIWDDLNLLSKREFVETFSSTNNRLLEFLASPTLRQMFSVKDEALDLRRCMDEGHIILVNLQPKRISRDSARVIGTLLTNTLFAYATQRNAQTSKAHPFYLYIDECYRFLTDDIESMLDETRKYGLHVCLAHQRLGQLARYGEHILNAVLTNAQTKVIFGGLADEDAEMLVKEVMRQTFDYNRPKTILDKPTVVGYEITHLRSWSEGESRSNMVGNSTMAASASGASSGLSMTQLYDDTGVPIGITHTEGTASGVSNMSSSGSGTFLAEGDSRSVSMGKSEALKPVLEWMHTSLESQDEIMHRAILMLRTLPARTYLLAKPETRPTILQTPLITASKILGQQLLSFHEHVRQVSPYSVHISALFQEEDLPLIDDIDDLDAFSVPES